MSRNTVEIIEALLPFVGVNEPGFENELEKIGGYDELERLRREAQLVVGQTYSGTPREGVQGLLNNLGPVESEDCVPGQKVRLELLKAYATLDVADAIRELAEKISR